MLLTGRQAVLTLFNSIGAGSSPPASDTAAAISAAGGVADPEHLESLLSQVNLNDGDVPCDRQHAAVPLESAKAVQSQPHAAGADAAAVDRFCIRNWMQVCDGLHWDLLPYVCGFGQ